MKPESNLLEGPCLLEARDLDVWYQRGLPSEVQALRGVSLRVRSGDRVGLMGGSGSGKSTLFHTLARLQEADSGSLNASAELGILPSLVFQFPERQLFAENVHAEIAYGLKQAGLVAEVIEERVQQALEDVGLPPEQFAHRAPFHLSAGEMRRVAVAGVLAQRRQLVLFDEPTLGLDAEGVARLQEILKRLHTRGVAYWLASHDADFVAANCTQLVVLYDGHIEFEGPAEDFWRDPQRAEALGVRVPRQSLLVGQLRALENRNPPENSDVQMLVEVLQSLAQET